MSRVITIKPTIENVIPYELYKTTNPFSQSIQEGSIDIPNNSLLPILFGGGRNMVICELFTEAQDKTVENDITLRERCQQMDMFVMDCGLIIWFDALQMGLQIQYNDIIYHGLHTRDELRRKHLSMVMNINVTGEISVLEDILIASLSPSSTGSIDLLITPIYYEEDRFYNDEIENLFIHEWFGLNKGNTMVNNVNEALDFCMERYTTNTLGELGEDGDDDNDNDGINQEEEVSSNTDYDGISFGLQHYYHSNYGMADDL